MTAPGGAGRTPLSAEAALSGRDVLTPAPGPQYMPSLKPSSYSEHRSGHRLFLDGVSLHCYLRQVLPIHLGVNGPDVDQRVS